MTQQLRQDLKDYEHFTASDPILPMVEWRTLHFECMILDEADGHSITEECHPDGFNMILVHPVTHALIWAYSADFEDYEPPKNQYRVRFTQSEIREFEMSADSMSEVFQKWLEKSADRSYRVEWLDEKIVSVELVKGDTCLNTHKHP